MNEFHLNEMLHLCETVGWKGGLLPKLRFLVKGVFFAPDLQDVDLFSGPSLVQIHA